MTIGRENTTVLICEDEVLIASDLEYRLTGLDYSVCGKVSSAEKAIEFVAEYHPDLVMMDIELKGDMDGIEAARIIKNEFAVPIVFLTAHDDRDRLERAKLTYPFGYILKPFRDRDLKITLEMALYVAKVDARRKTAEEELRLTLDATTEGIWSWNFKTNELYFSPKYYTMLGYEPNEFQASHENWLHLLHPDDLDSASALISEYLKTKPDSYHSEYRLKAKDGSYRWIHVTAKVVERDIDGEAVRMIGNQQDITHRKQFEDTLRISEMKFREFFNRNSNYCYMVSLDGELLDINPSAMRALGYEAKEELLGKPLIDMIYAPSSRERAQKLFSRWKRTGELNQEEINITTRTGEERTVLLSASAVKDNQGNLIHSISIHTDITERKKAEDELQASEQRYRAYVDHAPDAIFIADSTGKYLETNKAACRMTGYTESELMQMSISDLVSPASLVNGYKRFEKVKEFGQSKGEAEYVRKDGAHRYMSINAVRLSDDRFMAFCSDITEKLRSEQETSRYFRLLKTVILQAPFAAHIIEGEPSGMNVLLENPESRRIMGQKVEGLKGIDPNDPESLTCRFYTLDGKKKVPLHQMPSPRAFKGELVKNELFLFCHPDGTKIPVEASASPVFNENGRVVAVTVTFLDITQRIQAEEEQKRLNVQLQQAQKMEAVGTLAGGISHDFNNMLQAINGFTQLLLFDKTDNDPDYPNLKAIQEAGQRAVDLVRQLLLFSRKVEIERRPVDLNNEVERALKILERTIPKMIDIEVHLAGRLWTISADPLQIEQILLNLGTNAADAMSDGGRFIIETGNLTLDEDYTTTHFDAKPGDYVLLKVSDTGHGMDKETIANIFDPFYTTKGIGKGTGLGLASVYGIVKSHGGHIMCYSEVGQGATFNMYFPAIESDGAHSVYEKPDIKPKGGMETILLADDDKLVRKLGSQVLRKFGYTALTASTGEEALDIYTKRHDEIDLIILDIGMPGMGGHKCLRELIRFDSTAKVIIASGYSMNDQVRDSLELGALDFIGKPFQLNDLAAKVRVVLDGDH